MYAYLCMDGMYRYGAHNETFSGSGAPRPICMFILCCLEAETRPIHSVAWIISFSLLLSGSIQFEPWTGFTHTAIYAIYISTHLLHPIPSTYLAYYCR